MHLMIDNCIKVCSKIGISCKDYEEEEISRFKRESELLQRAELRVPHKIKEMIHTSQGETWANPQWDMPENLICFVLFGPHPKGSGLPGSAQGRDQS